MADFQVEGEGAPRDPVRIVLKKEGQVLDRVEMSTSVSDAQIERQVAQWAGQYDMDTGTVNFVLQDVKSVLRLHRGQSEPNFAPRPTEAAEAETRQRPTVP